jgi:hypothetical protein
LDAQELPLFPFTFFVSEDVSVIALLLSTIMAWYLSRRRPTLIPYLLLAFVGTGLCGWLVLVVSGLLGPYEWPWNLLHGAAGHVLLPVLVSAFGLWLGSSMLAGARHPYRVLWRLLALLLLCLCCFSNARTGYLGPSRIDPQINLATKIRFDVLHQGTFPLYIGFVLALWFYRLVTRLVRLPNERLTKLGTAADGAREPRS